MMSRNDPMRRPSYRMQDYDRGAPPRSRFPEVKALGHIFAWMAPWFILFAIGRLLFVLAIAIPDIHAALWPGWAVGLVAAYLGTVIVRALR